MPDKLEICAALQGISVSGPTPGATRRAEGVIREANFGAGWEQLVTETVDDLQVYDEAAWELIYFWVDDCAEPPEGDLMGICRLPWKQCAVDGDRVVYTTDHGNVHRLHPGRVLRLAQFLKGPTPFDYRAAFKRALEKAMPSVSVGWDE